MVANPEHARPGTPDALVNELRSLRREVAELSRRGPAAFYDATGDDVLAPDAAAGWGLKKPTLDVGMYPDTPDAPTVTTATWTTLWHGYFTIMHPRLYFSAMLVTKGAGSVAGQLRWQIDTPTVTAFQTPVATQSGVGFLQDTQIYDFLQADQNTVCTVRLQVQMSGTVVGGNLTFGYPLWAWRVRSTYPN